MSSRHSVTLSAGVRTVTMCQAIVAGRLTATVGPSTSNGSATVAASSIVVVDVTTARRHYHTNFCCCYSCSSYLTDFQLPRF